MTTKKLSILVPSLNSRAALFDRLMVTLLPQVQAHPGVVELIANFDNGEKTIGTKRNELVAQSEGEFICFVDDDDLVACDYVDRILKALALNPDCVGFWVDRSVNGRHEGLACHSLRFNRYATNDEGAERIYERTPNHLNPIRRSLAACVPFPELNHGEDTSYASRIYPLLESEVFIDADLYHYLFVGMDQRNEVTNETRMQQSPEEWYASRITQ